MLSNSVSFCESFPGGSVVKNPPDNAGDSGSISGSGISPRIGKANSLQYSCLENSMDRGAWWATVHGVTTEATKQGTQGNVDVNINNNDM